jgi:hypothetical protein
MHLSLESGDLLTRAPVHRPIGSSDLIGLHLRLGRPYGPRQSNKTNVTSVLLPQSDVGTAIEPSRSRLSYCLLALS